MRIETYVRNPVQQPRRKSARVGRYFYMQKENSTEQQQSKLHERSIRTVHSSFFAFWKFLVFCLYKDRPGSWPAVWHNEKRLRFVSNADIFSWSTVPPSNRFHRLRSQYHIFLPIFFYFFLFSPFLFLTSSLRAKWNTRSHNPIESFSLSSLLLSHASLLPYPPFFRLALNKYRFRLSELTPVSALYPLLTRIEFRTEDRFLFCRDLFGGSRDNVFPFFLLLFFKFPSNDAGRRDRKCVGVFAQKGTSTKLNRYH